MRPPQKTQIFKHFSSGIYRTWCSHSRNCRVAIETSILVVRAFIHAREILSEYCELKSRLDWLEEKVARGFQDNEDELQAIRFAIEQLMKPIESTSRRPIGFGCQ